jgi:predicted nucleotidyltransferase
MLAMSSAAPRPDLDAEVTSRLASWCLERGVRLCVLFGSRATGKAAAGSDWDLALWAPAIAPRQRLRWHRELEEVVGGEVHLVLVGPDTSPVLGFEVVRDGRVLFEDETERWLRERERLWKLYDDSLPFRRAARERLREFARAFRDGT